MEGVMPSPIWIVVFYPCGGHFIVQCASAGEAERTIFHNNYYGRRCLKVRVKAWRGQ